MNTDVSETKPEMGCGLCLVGCGILQREVDAVIAHRGWSLATHYLDSSLHLDYRELKHQLTQALAEHPKGSSLVFYGCCHPLMDRILAESDAVRPPGQNCLSMLLGDELFQKELLAGSFFLLEEWTQNWHQVMEKTFGKKKQINAEIFRASHKGFLAINPPCSGDFTQAAEAIAQEMNLPLRWINVNLDHLEQVLEEALRLRLARRATS